MRNKDVDIVAQPVSTQHVTVRSLTSTYTPTLVPGASLLTCLLPVHPRMSQMLMMKRIREEDAGFGKG